MFLDGIIGCLDNYKWVDACRSIACIPEDVASITTFIYNAIRIVTPLVLVIIGMFDMAKAITAGKQEEIRKSQQLFVKRAVAAAIVFLLFSLITWMLDILNASKVETTNVISCLDALFNHESTSSGGGSNTNSIGIGSCRDLGYDGVLEICGYASSPGTAQYNLSPTKYDTCYSVCSKKTDDDSCKNANSTVSSESYLLNDGVTYCVTKYNNQFFTLGKAYNSACATSSESQCGTCCQENGYNSYSLSQNKQCMCVKSLK